MLAPVLRSRFQCPRNGRRRKGEHNIFSVAQGTTPSMRFPRYQTPLRSLPFIVSYLCYFRVCRFYYFRSGQTRAVFSRSRWCWGRADGFFPLKSRDSVTLPCATTGSGVTSTTPANTRKEKRKKTSNSEERAVVSTIWF